MKRDDCIIMYDTNTHSNDDKRRICCFACIGRERAENLCNYLYRDQTLNYQFYFTCGVHGYNTNAVRHLHDVFDNTVNKILMTTEQCFLCDRRCTYSLMQKNIGRDYCRLRNDEIYKTMKYYKEVVGIP